MALWNWLYYSLLANRMHAKIVVCSWIISYWLCNSNNFFIFAVWSWYAGKTEKRRVSYQETLVTTIFVVEDVWNILWLLNFSTNIIIILQLHKLAQINELGLLLSSSTVNISPTLVKIEICCNIVVWSSFGNLKNKLQSTRQGSKNWLSWHSDIVYKTHVSNNNSFSWLIQYIQIHTQIAEPTFQRKFEFC